MALTREDYERAERFLSWNAEPRIGALRVEPHWLDDGRFWYRLDSPEGRQFILVDPVERIRQAAFDHVRLAAALTRASGKPSEHRQLPFDEIALEGDHVVRFAVDGQRWSCDLTTYDCIGQGSIEEAVVGESSSPDGRWVAVSKDHNLYLRSVKTGETVALTTDGMPGYAHSAPIPSPLKGAGIVERNPFFAQNTVHWSPDSRHLLSYRIDERGSGAFHLVQSTPLNGSRRPVLHSYPYPLPGDETVPLAELSIFDVETRASRSVKGVTLPLLYYGSPLRAEWIWWSDEGDRLYFITRARGYQSYALTSVDATTGESRTLVEERAATGIDPHLTLSGRPVIRVFEDGVSILWFSQRDGWGHLYLYDGRSGELRHQVTAGAWAVMDVVHIDEQARLVYFTAVGREAGRDPYYEHLYRVSLDGGEPELLTPEDATHQIAFAPDGTCFVDAYSRVDLPPVTVLRTPDGDVSVELERADVSRLEAMGWRPPERFRVKARDGVTDICGILIRPTTFAPASGAKLPILDDIYAGPQTNRAPAAFAAYSSAPAGFGPSTTYWHAHAIAELGFAVVMVDGLGMPYRAKAFQDRAYRNLGDGGIEDHVVAIRQLAERYPYLDAGRVGIYGHSAGGYASMHAMLTFPDFYKVAVSSAGNHDHRLDKASWVERYMGLPVGDHYHAQANSTLAQNLKGHLLLIHGEMDENVHVASTLQLVDALIQANKDFDLLIMPNQPHACTTEPYFIRRRWDYFVRHLLGVEPPAGYQIARPPA